MKIGFAENTLKEIDFPDLKGMKILDVGPASGFFSFYMEQAGAEVASVELLNTDEFNKFGFNPLTKKENSKTFNESSFKVLYSLLNSKIRYLNGSIYDIGNKILKGEKFDLVFVGSLLIHLRDPIGGLMSLSSICREGQIIATTPVWEGKIDVPEPMMKWANASFGSINWWLPNKSALEGWFLAAGFKDVNVTNKYFQYADLSRPHPTKGTVNTPISLYVVKASGDCLL